MPMPKPKEGQSQSDFMSDCMSEAFGDDAPKDRTQDQAVAMCMSAWREEHGGKKPSDKDMPHYLAMWRRLLASPAYRKKIEVMNTSTPAAGESEESFMQRCTKELTGGASGVSEREAADACRLTWGNINAAPKDPGQPAPAMAQSGDRAAKVKRIIARFKERYGEDPGPAILKAMEPEPDESREDFLDRCLDEMGDREDAQDMCEDAWDEADDDRREESAGGLVLKTHSTAGQEKEFILSDATPDRFGDIVEVEGWQFDSFNRNPIALFNHNASFPVGTWANIRVGEKALRGDLILAPKGISPRIDEIRGLVEAGILRAVSVGFKPLSSRPVDATKNDPFGMAPQIYTKSELVECSLVSIPANPNALAVAKSLNISAETQKMVFAEHGNQKTVRRSATTARARAEHGNKRASAPSPAEYGRTHSIVKGQTMLLGKRIEEGEKFIVRLRDQLQDHLAHVDDQNPDDAGMAVTEELTAKIALAERNLKSLKDAEARLGNGGDGSGNGSDSRAELLGSTAFRQADRAIAERMGKPDYGPRPFGLTPKKIDAVDYLIRQGVIEAFRKVKGIDADQARQMIYGNDECTRAYLDYAQKAASAMANTTVTGWAAELVQQVYGDFLQILVPTSVMPNLANLGLALTFGRAGRIVIPSRSATPSLAGSFVGEGQPIPVRQGAFTTQTLVPKKLGVITSWTREMDQHSIPAIEGVLRDSVAIDTGVAIDAVLMDANPATVIRPPGLRNGVAGLTATAGGGFTALIGDIKQLAGALLTATAGHVRVGCFLMNPQQTLSISLMQPPNAAAPLFPLRDEVVAGRLGTFRLIQSANVPLGTVIALDAADFVTVGAEAPRFEVSDQATIHMEDTAPSDITGGTPSPAVPVRSMFQTDSIALRLVWPLNWTLRRPQMVAWVSSVTW